MDVFLATPLGGLILTIVKALLLLVPLLIGVAYLTYAERKVLAAMQLRKGPNVVGPFGLFQPFADALKMITKETILPAGANRGLFLLAPMLTFSLAMIAWAVIPVSAGWANADINVGVLYLFAISSLGVYGVIIAGWASNSKYAFLGALRSAAQMVSYEVSMGFVIVTVLLCVGSLNITAVVEAQRHWWFCVPLFPDVRRLLHLDARGDQPRPLRSARGRKRDRGGLLRRVFVNELRAVLPRRIRQHDPDGSFDNHTFPRRLAGTFRIGAVHLDTGPDLVRRQDLLLPLRLPLGASDIPALPLRPAHAAGLEGVSAAVLVLVGVDGRRSGVRWLVAGHVKRVG